MLVGRFAPAGCRFWSRLAGRLVPVAGSVAPGCLASWSRLVGRLAPAGYRVGPGWLAGLSHCWAAWLPVGWPVNLCWRAGWSRLAGRLVWSCLACSCFVRDPCSVHESFPFIPSRRPQNTDYERTNLRIPLRSRLYPSRPYVIEVTSYPL